MKRLLCSVFHFQPRVCNLNERNLFQMSEQVSYKSDIVKLTFRSIAEDFVPAATISSM